MIHLVCDTSPNLPAELVAEHEITLVPIYIYYGNETLREGFDLDTAGYYRRQSNHGEAPSTSAPPVSDFIDAYEAIFEADPEASILSIHVSSYLSGTIGAAQQAAKQLAGRDIRIIDTYSCTIGHGLLAVEAAMLIRQGYSADAIAQHLTAMRDQQRMYVGMEGLGPLAQSGRLYRLSRMAASLGSMKPIIMTREGTLEGHAKWDERPQMVDTLRDLALSAAAANGKLRLGITYGQNEAEALTLGANLCDALQPEMFLTCQLGPAFSYYFGNRALGVAWF